MSAADRSAAQDRCSDPFARGGDRHWFWWADQSYIRPGLHFRHVRLFDLDRRRWTRVTITTSGKTSYGYPTRWRLVKAAFSRPGKDIYLG